MKFLAVVLVILGIAATACAEADSSASEPDVADACLPGAPDCEDTVASDLPAEEPERGVSVGDATAQPIDGAFELRGYFVADDGGARLCETLIESFPPQCGGASLPVGDFDVGVRLSSEAGVSWTDQVVYLEGEIIGGVFQPLR